MTKLFPWLLFLIALFFFPPSFFPLTDGKWVAVYAAGIFSAIYLWRRGGIALGRGPALAAAAVALLSVAQTVWLRPRGFVFVLADRFSLWLLALGFARAFADGLRPRDFWLPASLGAFFTAVFALAGLGDPAGGLAGGPAAAAETAGFLFVLALAAPAPERKRPLIALLFFGLTAAVVVFVVMQRGPLSALAIGFVAVAHFQRRFSSYRRAASYGILAAFLGSLMVFLANGFPPGPDRGPGAGLPAEMIRENILGVGPGRYGFAALPYLRERGRLVEGAPLAPPANVVYGHAVEDGLPLALAFGALWVLLVMRWRKRGAGEQSFAAPGLIFLGVGALVSPIFLGALPAAGLAMLAGLLLAPAPEREAGSGPVAEPAAIPVWRRGGLGALLLLALSPALAAMASRGLESQPGHAATACAITPENWRACLLSAHELQEKGDWQPARRVVEEVLANEPANFIALQQLVFIAGSQRRNLEACFLLWRYDDFYGGNSSQHERLTKNCLPKWLEYFHRRRPTRYYERQGKSPTGFEEMSAPQP